MLTESAVVYISFFYLPGDQVCMSMVACIYFMFCLMCASVTFMCFDVCSVFVVVECSLFLLFACCWFVRE